MKGRRGLGVLLLAVVVLWAFLGWAKDRDFALITEYNRVVVGLDKKEWEFDVRVLNQGKEQEEVLLSVEAPKGWKAALYKKWDGFQVKGVTLGTDEANNSVLLALKVSPPEEGVEEGKGYIFKVHGRTADGALSRTLTFVLEFEKGVKSAEAKKVILKAEYPSVRGAAGDRFEYVIEIKNEGDKAQAFELLAEAPPGWAAYCTPRWEEEKKISAIKVDSKSSEWIKFFLIPPPMVTTGEYPAKLIVKSETEEEGIDLKAVITGTYELKVGSEAEVLGTGETRNVKAVAGQEKRYVFYVWNEGSAPITDLKFLATQKPKNWEVSFDPERIPSLKPVTLKAPEFQKVEAKIKPPEKAIPGDYIVAISAVGNEDRADLELRVTVGKPMVWGWIGIGIVVAVVVALVMVFVKLGRR